MIDKKAQGLSLNTIIIAVIVLIVLIVLWAIFTGRMGLFTSNLKTEEGKAMTEAEKFEKMAAGGGCVPEKNCGDLEGSASQCTSYGCMGGGTTKSEKCTGSNGAWCNSKKKEECNSPCKWI